jgi:hypothetical protein
MTTSAATPAMLSWLTAAGMKTAQLPAGAG